MRRILVFLLTVLLVLGLAGCGSGETAQIAATTMPVACFTRMLCEGTDLSVAQVVTEEVSCLHDYTLTVSQMRLLEGAELVVISGAGLEEFMEEALHAAPSLVDASAGVSLLESDGHHHHEQEDHDHSHAHAHEHDPHIWLSPANAAIMAKNIHAALSARYPEHRDTFDGNLAVLLAEIEAVDRYAREQLADLSTREIIPFHDGFSYLAEAYDLHILQAIEEESGAEISARELIELITLVEHHGVTALFVEENGSGAAASVISRETGIPVYTLTMAMSGESWFEAMYRNIDTLKEALS